MIPAVQCSGSVQRCRYVFSIGIFNQRVNVDADDVLVTMLSIHGGGVGWGAWVWGVERGWRVTQNPGIGRRQVPAASVNSASDVATNSTIDKAY